MSNSSLAWLIVLALAALFGIFGFATGNIDLGAITLINAGATLVVFWVASWIVSLVLGFVRPEGATATETSDEESSEEESTEDEEPLEEDGQDGQNGDETDMEHEDVDVKVGDAHHMVDHPDVVLKVIRVDADNENLVYEATVTIPALKEVRDIEILVDDESEDQYPFGYSLVALTNEGGILLAQRELDGEIQEVNDSEFDWGWYFETIRLVPASSAPTA